VPRFQTDQITEWLKHPCTVEFLEELELLDSETKRDMEEFVAQEKFYKSSQVLGYTNAICDIRRIPGEWMGDQEGE